MAFPFEPRGSYIVIEKVDVSDDSESKIILPQVTKEQMQPNAGKVVAVGPGHLLPDGSRKDMEINVGDVVLWSPFNRATEMHLGGNDYIIIGADGILGKFLGYE